jgi:nucleoside-diphosphate-sugar epimerase
MMFTKIFVLGIDGYMGWPLALKQLSEGNKIFGIDNLSRRKNVENKTILGRWRTPEDLTGLIILLPSDSS